MRMVNDEGTMTFRLSQKLNDKIKVGKLTDECHNCFKIPFAAMPRYDQRKPSRSSLPSCGRKGDTNGLRRSPHRNLLGFGPWDSNSEWRKGCKESSGRVSIPYLGLISAFFAG